MREPPSAGRLCLVLESSYQGGRQATRERGLLPFLLPALLSIFLLVWTIWIGVAAFTNADFAFEEWRTRYREWFGFAWLASSLVILVPCYLASIGLGLMAWTVREPEEAAERRSHWVMSLAMTAFLLLLTFGVRVMVTAWFPSPLLPPFEEVRGGPGVGLLAFCILSVAVLLFDRTVRRHSPYDSRGRSVRR